MLFVFRDRIFKSGVKEENLENRVDIIDKTIAELKSANVDTAKDIKTIKENHLAHIQADINNINVKMERMATTLEFIKNK